MEYNLKFHRVRLNYYFMKVYIEIWYTSLCLIYLLHIKLKKKMNLFNKWIHNKKKKLIKHLLNKYFKKNDTMYKNICAVVVWNLHFVYCLHRTGVFCIKLYIVAWNWYFLNIESCMCIVLCRYILFVDFFPPLYTSSNLSLLNKWNLYSLLVRLWHVNNKEVFCFALPFMSESFIDKSRTCSC